MMVSQNTSSPDIIVINTTQTNCVPIIAGQSINVGQICFDDVDTDSNGYDDVLKVTYTTTNGWELTEAHFHIAEGLSGIPVTKKGNPIPGQFAYNSGPIIGTTYTFTIPFSAINISCPSQNPFSRYYAAHCVVRKNLGGTSWQTETGWGAGPGFSGSNWGMYNQFTLYCDNPPPPPPPSYRCETAFGKGIESLAKCFICNFEDPPYLLGNCQGPGSGRWGWSNGPYNTGNYTLELWAAAGLCNTSNGTLVGNISINYNGTTAVVTYTTSTNFTLDAVHLYVGSEPLYKKLQGQQEYTIAPGQFPYKGEGLPPNTTTYTFTINNISGPIYVVAHAVVCGNYPN